MIGDVRLLHPAVALLALVALPVAGLYIALLRARRQTLARFAGRGAELVSSSGRATVAHAVLVCVAVIALAIAMAGPYVDLREVQVRWKGVDVAVALDVSQSMGTQDVKPDRLHVARSAIETMAEALPGTRIALVLFGGNGIVRYPATSDPKILAAALDNPGREYRPSSGTSLQSGVDAAIQALPADSALPKAVVLISDGEDLAAPTPDVAAYLARGVHLFALAVGTTAGGTVPSYDPNGKYVGMLVGADGAPVVSRMHEETLAAYARSTDGMEWRYDGSAGSIQPLLTSLVTMTTGDLSSTSTDRRPDDRFQLFGALALAALLADWLVRERRAMPRPRSIRIGGRRSALLGALLVVVLGACSSATSTNQTANDFYGQGKFVEALDRYHALLRDHPELAEVSVNAGNALYQEHDYARAVASYDAALASADSRLREIAYYDEGDALFREGKLPEARSAFVQALRLDPSDRDAKFNIEVIDRIAAAAQGVQGQPGQAQATGSQQPNSATQSGTSQQPLDPSSVQQSQGQGGSDQQVNSGDALTQALQDFRQDLTPDDAQRLIEALLSQQPGLGGYLERGPTSPGQDPQY